MNQDGTINILDKSSNKSYSRLLGYIDDGEIGDGWYHVNPTEDKLVYSTAAGCTVEKIENGPSKACFRLIRRMNIPKEMEYYSHGIRRSGETVTMDIISDISLCKGSRKVEVDTTVINNAKDHRLRLVLPTGINSPSFFANQPFAFVERKTGIDFETQNWKECAVPEKQMSGIVFKRATDGTGLAFVSAFGLHECAALNDSDGSILITLFRSFRKTVMTNGETGGQIQGELNFKYSIVPIQKTDTYADLARIQDCLCTGIKSTSVQVPKEYTLSSPFSYFELKSKNICMSIFKRAEDKKEGNMIVRLYNLSDHLGFRVK